jgi:alpha-glucosidase
MERSWTADPLLENYRWWQRGIIYQIYPRSFMDSNGDGVGDLSGIRSELDYLQWLGVDAIWISPIYPSPMADFGYDISNYTDIDPIFGTLADFDLLVADAHRRRLKVLLDFVPNHSSDQHPWFLESRSSTDNPKRDWYIWRDPAHGGRPPNNWLATFGGPAWEWDEQTGQYYYHAFLKEQPDLNWRNPEVQEAMLGVLRFWLDRGVDGFRVDVMHHIVKDNEFRDNPPNPAWRTGMWPYRELLATYSTDRPEVHDIVERMRGVLEEYGDRVLVGEIYLPVERLVTYYGASGKGAHLPFNFQLIGLPWNARDIAAAVDRYEALLPSFGWPNWVLGNHDKSRLATRVGAAQARVAAMLLLTLRGTPTIYYGDEIGMHDVLISPENVQDRFEKNVPGLKLGRDPERTPMQWTDSANAGFTSGKPWLPIADDYESLNVAIERKSPNSILMLYRRLIELRRTEPALAVGEFTPLPAARELIAYIRKTTGRRLLIVLNLGTEARDYRLADLNCSARLLLSTHVGRFEAELSEKIELRGDEGVIIELL